MKARYVISVFCLSGVLVGWAGDDPIGLGKAPLDAESTGEGVGKQPLGGMEISGAVFYDSNENGILDPGEDGRSGMPVYAYLGDALVASTTTDESGNYTLTVEGEGMYRIVLGNGYFQDLDVPRGAQSVTLNHGILLDRIPSLAPGDTNRGLNILNPLLINTANILRPRSTGERGVQSVTPFRP